MAAAPSRVVDPREVSAVGRAVERGPGPPALVADHALAGLTVAGATGRRATPPPPRGPGPDRVGVAPRRAEDDGDGPTSRT